jgi:hypothetical protein
MTPETLFTKAFNSMPNQFTGDMFVAKLRELGMKPITIKYCEKKRTEYYRNNTTKVNRRTYEKRNLFNQDKAQSAEEKAVTLLKSLGYKLFKPTTEFKEI